MAIKTPLTIVTETTMIKVSFNNSFSRLAKTVPDEVIREVFDRDRLVEKVVTDNLRKEINAWTSSGSEGSTGKLANSYEITQRKRGDNEAEIDIKSDLSYARIHEVGGTILPKGGGKLTFESRRRGWVSLSRARIKPKHYIRKAAARSIEQLRELTAEFVRIAVRRL